MMYLYLRAWAREPNDLLLIKLLGSILAVAFNCENFRFKEVLKVALYLVVRKFFKSLGEFSFWKSGLFSGVVFLESSRCAKRCQRTHQKWTRNGTWVSVSPKFGTQNEYWRKLRIVLVWTFHIMFNTVVYGNWERRVRMTQFLVQLYLLHQPDPGFPLSVNSKV